jgi:type I restriction enzyme S subunit
VKLGEIARVVTGGTPSRDNPDYWGGKIPWVSTGLIDFDEILSTDECITEEGLRNSSAKVFPKGTVLMAMFGQGVTRGKVATLGVDAAFNQACVAIISQSGDSSRFLYQFLAHNYSAIRQLSNAGSQENLNAGLIKGIGLDLPPPEEQVVIGQVGDTWDRSLQTLRNLIGAKRRYKLGLFQQLLTGRRRFREFAKQSWLDVRLGDVTVESSLRNGSRLGVDAVMAVTKAEGMVPMKEGTIGASLDRYKLVRRGWFAYNPMRVNIGSIARWTGESEVLVSPDYVVFQCKAETDLGLFDRQEDGPSTPLLDPDFLDHYRRSRAWEQFVTASGNGSVRVRIYYDDLARLRLKLPSLAEQKRIAAVLNAADRDIYLLRQQLTLLREQKKGLMQKLLTSQVRVGVDQ